MNGEPLTESRIAIGAARTIQADSVRSRLEKRGLTGITVDTANRLQGREFDVTLVWHPLSGRQDVSAFHLETGRLCVLLSRHRFACIVVARAGITDLLYRHSRSSPGLPRRTTKVPGRVAGAPSGHGLPGETSSSITVCRPSARPVRRAQRASDARQWTGRVVYAAKVSGTSRRAQAASTALCASGCRCNGRLGYWNSPNTRPWT
ncbi:hypothetical protein ACFWY6_34080 [Streptomyces sp. NPDC059037]|uniref:hypothetical protein n=1 Tax=Streptomyces sp. NPDC059037 TaxID=3346710 RepID=UPI00368B19EC